MNIDVGRIFFSKKFSPENIFYKSKNVAKFFTNKQRMNTQTITANAKQK